MTEIQSPKQPKVYDLEERTFVFASKCNNFLRNLPSKTMDSIEYGKQLIRSSGSVAANYIEANEALSKKDFFYRIKICRKEVKESRLWLKLFHVPGNEDLKNEQNRLIQETFELTKIFTSIVGKNKSMF